MLETISRRRNDVYRIARSHRARRLYVFGSCARREERPDSDVDFLVKFEPTASLLDNIAMEREFSQLLGRKVDVVSTSVLKSEPRFAYQVCKDVVEI